MSEGRRQTGEPIVAEQAAAEARRPFDQTLEEERETLTVRQRAMLKRRAVEVAERTRTGSAMVKLDAASVDRLRREILEGDEMVEAGRDWVENLKDNCVLEEAAVQRFKKWNRAAWLRRVLGQGDFRSIDIALAESLIHHIGSNLIEALNRKKFPPETISVVKDSLNKGVIDGIEKDVWLKSRLADGCWPPKVASSLPDSTFVGNPFNSYAGAFVGAARAGRRIQVIAGSNGQIGYEKFVVELAEHLTQDDLINAFDPIVTTGKIPEQLLQALSKQGIGYLADRRQLVKVKLLDQ